MYNLYVPNLYKIQIYKLRFSFSQVNIFFLYYEKNASNQEKIRNMHL